MDGIVQGEYVGWKETQGLTMERILRKPTRQNWDRQSEQLEETQGRILAEDKRVYGVESAQNPAEMR